MDGILTIKSRMMDGFDMGATVLFIQTALEVKITFSYLKSRKGG